MAFISFSEKAKAKFNPSVLWQAQKDITLAEGKIEKGTILRVYYEACVADENGIYMTTFKLRDPVDYTIYGELAIDYEEFDNMFIRAKDAELKYSRSSAWLSGFTCLMHGCGYGLYISLGFMLLSVICLQGLTEFISVPAWTAILYVSTFIGIAASIIMVIGLVAIISLQVHMTKLLKSQPRKVTLS